MSQAENLLEGLTSEDISLYTTNPETEEHIVITEDRYITVPGALQRIAVQYDHNIETVTFDCPRYWDNNDLSKMHIYINYQKPDNEKGRYLAKNVTVDETDNNIIHFEWTIGNELTQVGGQLQFLVCAVKTDSEGNEVNHWNTEINTQMFISSGLECTDVIPEAYPDIINDLFTRLDTIVEGNNEIISNTETVLANNAELTTRVDTVMASNEELVTATENVVAANTELVGRIETAEDTVEANDNRITDMSNEFYRVKDEILETGEANGSIIDIQDSSLSRLQTVAVDGVTDQEITTGKNEFNLQEHYQNSNNVIVTEVGDNNLKIEVTANTTWAFTQYAIRNLEKNTNYKLLFDYKNSNSALTTGYILIKGIVSGENVFNDNNNGKIEFNTGEETDFYFRFGATRGTATTNTAEYSNIMLCLASETDDYEPYTGGIASPNPDYPSPISIIRDNFKLGSHAKNYYNYKNVANTNFNGITTDEDGWITLSGDNTSGTSGKFVNYFTKFIQTLKKSTKYTAVLEVKNVSGGGKLNLFTSYYEDGKMKQTQIGSSIVKDFSELTNDSIVIIPIITLSYFSYATYGVRSFASFSAGLAGSITYRLSILEDTSITADSFVYEPYQETSIDISIPEGEFIAEGDMLSVEYNEEDGKDHLYLDKVVGRYTFTGNDDWAFQGAPGSNPDGYQFRSSKSINNLKETSLQAENHLLCDYFQSSSWNQYWLKDNVIVQIMNVDSYNKNKVIIVTNVATTVEEFKTWLAENNVTVLYRLAEPYRLDLGVVDIPLSYHPVTHIFTDHELQPNIEVKYYRNFETTVRNLQVNEQALKQELIDVNTRLTALENTVANLAVAESEVSE